MLDHDNFHKTFMDWLLMWVVPVIPIDHTQRITPSHSDAFHVILRGRLLLFACRCIFVHTRFTDVGCCCTEVQLCAVLEEHCPTSDHALAVRLPCLAPLYSYILMFAASLVPPQIVLLCKVEPSTNNMPFHCTDGHPAPSR